MNSKPTHLQTEMLHLSALVAQLAQTDAYGGKTEERTVQEWVEAKTWHLNHAGAREDVTFRIRREVERDNYRGPLDTMSALDTMRYAALALARAATQDLPE